MNIYNILAIKIHLIVLLLLLSVLSIAQVEFDNPYDCIYNHLYYLQADSYLPHQSAKSLFNNGDTLLTEERAIELKQILDAKGLYVYMSKVPNETNYSDSLTGKNIYYLFPKELPEIYLEKYDNTWLYSIESLNSISFLHQKTYPWGTAKLIKLFPLSSEFTLLGISYWQYFGLFVLIFSVVVFYFLLSKVFVPIFKSLSKIFFKRKTFDHGLLLSISKYLSLLFVFYVLKIFLPILQLPVKLMEYSIVSIRIVITIIGSILFFRLVDWALKYLEDITQKTKSKMDDQLIPIVSKMLKILIIVFASFYILQIFNVNITALIAGLSIGGLALALAAQDTVKNLIGSVMIFIDQPFQIGDYIEVSGMAGTVQEVGFRTTRILAKDTSIIAIPNSTMSNAAVRNKGVRTYRLFETTLGLTYSTKPDEIESFKIGLLELIAKHPKVLDENFLVHFVKMDASSLNILFRAYLIVIDYNQELQVGEELQLSILRLANELGIEFAFPSTSVYVEAMPKD